MLLYFSASFICKGYVIASRTVLTDAAMYIMPTDAMHYLAMHALAVIIVIIIICLLHCRASD